PEQSIYNRLADIEWDTPIGAVPYFGGDVLIRADALRQAGGYNSALIAGEDPDLSIRLRQQGGTILRIDAEMTVHDMAMTRFGQWWRRCVRTGVAFAEGVAMHGRPPERHWVHEYRSTIIWGMALPMIILALAWPTRGASLLLALAYPLQILRIARRQRRAGLPPRNACLYAWRHGTPGSTAGPASWAGFHTPSAWCVTGSADPWDGTGESLSTNRRAQEVQSPPSQFRWALPRYDAPRTARSTIPIVWKCDHM